MAQKFSEILVIRSEFNFFQSIANLEPFDLSRLEVVIDDVLNYILRVKEIFEYLDAIPDDLKVNLDWLAEGKSKYYDIYRNIDSIDSVVLQSLNLLETNLNEDSSIVDTGIFDKLDKLSELSLDVKQNHLLKFKTNVDVSTEYHEIFNTTMNSINNELENCLKKCFRIHEKRFSSPVRHAPIFNLEMLTKKLLQQKSNLRLPLLNEVDNELYEEFLDLKSIVDPLRASLHFIPLRIEEFHEKHKELGSLNVAKITTKYNSLVKELDFLQNEVNDLKYELVDKRWDEIFSYLNTEMSFLISSVEKETKKLNHLKDKEEHGSIETQILKKMRYTCQIVESTFTLVNQAIDEKLIDITVVEKTNQLAERWLNAKGTIPEEYTVYIDGDDLVFEELKQFKTLSLDEDNSKKIQFDEESKETKTPVKFKRRSRAGEFFMGKMNLRPVLIENDPTSVRKPADPNNVPKNVLGESLRHNQLENSPSKPRLMGIKPQDFNKIPDLKTSLSKLPNEHILTAVDIPSSPPVVKSDLSTMSPIVEAQTPLNQNYTPSGFSNSDDDVFQTPSVSSKRTSIISSSRLPIPTKLKNSNPNASKIPRPSSRLGTLDRESSVSKLHSDGSSSVIRARPASALASTRQNQSERPPSRIGRMNKRHSMIPQTPIRVPSRTSERSISRTSDRRSLLPQPTPIKEIIERGGSRLSDRRPGSEFRSSRILDKPAKPIWR